MPSTTAAPSATRSPEPTGTPIPTHTSIPTSTPTPTNTSVPTLPPPDFDQLLTFGGGGGDAPCLYVPNRSLPAVEGSTAFGDYYGGRAAILCIWGAPFGVPLDIYLTSPNRQTVLKGSAVVEPSTSKVKWQGKELAIGSGGAANLGSTTAMYLSLWWPAQLEPGTWQVQVLWPGDGVFGSFTAKTGNSPQLSMMDPRAMNELRVQS